MCQPKTRTPNCTLKNHHTIIHGDSREMNKSLIDILFVELGGAVLKPKVAISSSVSYDRDTLLYEANGPFGIQLHSFAQTDLDAELYEELALLWREYAKVEPGLLTRDAQQLRQELLDSFEEKPLCQL